MSQTILRGDGMKRFIFLLIFILVVVITLSSCDGGLYTGDGWQDTPEKALEVEADNPLEEGRLTVAHLLDKWYIDDMAFMFFVSESDTLVEADFVTDEKGRFHYHASSEEVLLDQPDTFILNGEQQQFLLSSYHQYGTRVWGYKYSSVEITVNDITPKIETYTFSCQGKEWSIDRWWIEDIDDDTEVNIEYVSDEQVALS